MSLAKQDPPRLVNARAEPSKRPSDSSAPSLTRRGADKRKAERILSINSSDMRRSPLIVIQRNMIGRGPENRLDRLIAIGGGYGIVQSGRSRTFRSIGIGPVSDSGSRDSQVSVQRGQA